MKKENCGQVLTETERVRKVPSTLIFTGYHDRQCSTEARLLAVGDAQILSTLFDLTPAEVRISIVLMQGLSVKEVADRLHVEVSTVRSHLKSVFAKVGCASQADLVGICGSVLGDSPSINSRVSAARGT